MVKVISGATQISGVALNTPASHVLTNSLPLGVAPLVTIETESGQRYDGWIVGRDDSKNLALVKILDASLPGVDFGDSDLFKVGDEVLSLSYPTARSGDLISLETIITGRKTDFASGMRFFRLDIQPLSGPVFNRHGELVGIIVDPSFVQSLGFATGDEAFALVSQSVEPSLDALASGYVDLSPRPSPTPNPNQPPPVTTIFRGTITMAGVPPPAGSTVYVRVVNESLGDLWLSRLTLENGIYHVTVGAPTLYKNSPVEFYIQGAKSDQTATFRGAGDYQALDLTFP